MRALYNFIVDYWRMMCGRPHFKPQVIYNADLRLTEMILEDTTIVWCPWGGIAGHGVDCGYSPDGRLVGIQIWGDVRSRPDRGH